MLIILPYGLGISRDCRWSANWREVINAGRKFMDSILSKSSTLVSVMGENWLTPALLIMISISPHSSMIFRRQSSSAVLSLTSTRWNCVPVCRAVSFLRSRSCRRRPHDVRLLWKPYNRFPDPLGSTGDEDSSCFMKCLRCMPRSSAGSLPGLVFCVLIFQIIVCHDSVTIKWGQI